MKITKITLSFLALFILAGCNHQKKTHSGIVNTGEESSITKEFEKNTCNTVWFAYNSAALSHKSQEKLIKQACWLYKHPNVKATIEGHCDERGTRVYNLALGEKRAEAVKRFLEHKGIDCARLNTISYGKDRPAMMGSGEEAWAYNRRALTVVNQ